MFCLHLWKPNNQHKNKQIRRYVNTKTFTHATFKGNKSLYELCRQYEISRLTSLPFCNKDSTSVQDLFQFASISCCISSSQDTFLGTQLYNQSLKKPWQVSYKLQHLSKYQSLQYNQISPKLTYVIYVSHKLKVAFSDVFMPQPNSFILLCQAFKDVW